MRLVKCDIFDTKDSTNPMLENVFAYVAWCENYKLTDLWVGFFPIDKHVRAMEDVNLFGKKFLRANDGHSGEIDITNSKVDSAGNTVIEFEGVGSFESAA